MERIKQWIKEQSQKPRFGAKVLAIILMIIILFMPKNAEDNNEKQDKETMETSSSYEQEVDEENPSESIHIGTTNIIALAGGIIALAVVKNRERRFLNKHDKK